MDPVWKYQKEETNRARQSWRIKRLERVYVCTLKEKNERPLSAGKFYVIDWCTIPTMNDHVPFYCTSYTREQSIPHISMCD